MKEGIQTKMRTHCDACETAVAVFFCAADEAALCPSCDHKVHMCNRLVSRHVRVKLAEPKPVPQCDICESSPAFFYCEIDGTALCLHCDMAVHVGGKRTHGRYLLLRQRVQFPADTPGEYLDPALQLLDQNQMTRGENQDLQRNSPDLALVQVPIDEQGNAGVIDLNMNPHRPSENSSKDQP